MITKFKKIVIFLFATFCMMTSVVATEGPPRVSFTNEKNTTPDLFITKHVVSADDRYDIPDADFRFILKLDGVLVKNLQYQVYDEQGNEVFLHADGTQNSNAQNKVPFMSDRNGGFTLKKEQTAKFTYVGSGKSYEVSEILSDDRFIQVTPAPGVSAIGTVTDEGAMVKFTNMYIPVSNKDTADFIVSKNISYPEGYTFPQNVSFDFSLKIDGQAFANQRYIMKDTQSGDVVGEGTTDQSGNFTLEAGKSAVFERLSSNVDYELIEKSKDGWRVLGEAKREGAVKAPVTTEVYTNVNASFAVNKTLSDQSSSDDVFRFILLNDKKQAWSNASYYLYDKNGEVIHSEVLKTDEKGYFSLKSNQSAIFIGITPGTIYHVQEEANPKYVQKIPSSVQGYENKVVNDAIEMLPFVNEQVDQKGMLSVTKIINNTTDEAAHENVAFQFIIRKKDTSGVYQPLKQEVYHIINGANEESLKTDDQGVFYLKANQSARFKSLLLEEEYQIEEIQSNEEYAIKEENRIQEGKLTEQLQFVFQNDYTSKLMDIMLKKTDRDGNPLKGAEFALYMDEGMVNQVGENLVSKADGSITIPDCKSGLYYLKEVKSPTGYALLSNPIRIEISRIAGTKKLEVKMDGEVFDSTDSSQQIYIKRSTTGKDEIHITIFNDKSFLIPITGGIGIAGFLLISLSGMLGIVLYIRKSTKKLGEFNKR